MRDCNQRGPSGVVNGMLLSLAAIREEGELAYGPPVLGVAPNIPLKAYRR